MKFCRLALLLAAAFPFAPLRAAELPPAPARVTTPAPAPVTAAAPAEPMPPQPSAAEIGVQALVARQQALLAAAEKGDKDFDEDNFRTQMQNLANDYDDFLKKHPDYAPAYAAYGMMLGKISMRRESANMLLKADELFARAAKEGEGTTPAFIRTWALVHNQLGNYVAEEGKPLGAVNRFLSAIDLTPNEPLYHYQLGMLLTEARDDFLASGHWTRAALDKAMHGAFQRAAELAPDRLEFTYRYAESFYDLEQPDWDGALKVWAALEDKAKTNLDRQAMRLHAANILIKQRKFEHAQVLLTTITEAVLQKQKQALVELLPAAPTTAK